VLGDKAKPFKQEIKQLTGVQNATLTGALPTDDYGNTSTIFKDPVVDQKRSLMTQMWNIDEDYIPTLKMKMVAGRNFSSQMLTDSTAVIINETAAKALAYANPINQMLYVPQDQNAKILKPYHIVGVVKDFNFQSLRDNVTPLILFYGEDRGALSVNISSANIPSLVDKIKTKWTSFSPNEQFSYSFMDADFDSLYRTEQRISSLSVIFTSLAIIIACLGLVGLAAYAAEQRTKEIGIRKVLGASMSGIVGMLSRDFIKLVIIAIVIASPLAWYAMNYWLQDFAYRINIQWWIIALAGTAAILIAFVTISFQSIKAALTNPVKSLRSE